MKQTSTQLTVIIILVSLLIIICAVYLYANRGNEKIAEISLKSLLVPVFVAFGLLLIEYFKPLETKANSFIIATTDEPFTISRLLFGENKSSTYLANATMNITTFDSKIKQGVTKKKDISRLELLELYILRLINDRFQNGWKTYYQKSLPFFETGSVIKAPVENTKSKKYTLEDLKKVYNSNHLIQSVERKNIGEGLDLYLPEGARIDVSGNDLQRQLSITSRYINVVIKIRKEVSVALPHVSGKTAMTIRKKLDLPLDESYRLDFYGYTFDSKITPKRFYKGNPNTFEQMKWANELVEHIYESYSWERIYGGIEE
jgi:hypothetical protein